MNCFLSSNLQLKCVHNLLQYKYRLCTMRGIFAGEGVFGMKIKYDFMFNLLVNVKGRIAM